MLKGDNGVKDFIQLMLEAVTSAAYDPLDVKSLNMKRVHVEKKLTSDVK